MQSDDEETTNPAIVSWKMNMIRVDMNRQILRHSTKQIMIVLVFWAMMFAANATVYAQVEGNDPQSKVRLFYEAIGKGDCETALIIRSLDYSMKLCQSVTGVNFGKTDPAMLGDHGCAFASLVVATAPDLPIAATPVVVRIMRSPHVGARRRAPQPSVRQP